MLSSIMPELPRYSRHSFARLCLLGNILIARKEDIKHISPRILSFSPYSVLQSFSSVVIWFHTLSILENAIHWNGRDT